MVHCSSCGAVPVPESELPVVLPEDVPFLGRGGSPLQSEAAKAWRTVDCPCCKKPGATR